MVVISVMARSVFIFFIFFLFLFSSSVRGAETDEIPRTILAFYDASLVDDIFFTSVHQRAEMPLNYLGLKVVYRPIQSRLPTEEEMKGVLGILTWFRRLDTMTDPAAYCNWMKEQISKGRRYVILNEPGFFSRSRQLVPACKQAFEELGVKFENHWGNNPYFFETVSKDSRMVEFERVLAPYEGQEYTLYRPIKDDVKVFLTVKRRDIENSSSALVFTSPRGGFAHPSYVNFQDRDIDKISWRLNPFLFFAEAFGVQHRPIPDIATVNGRRVFYSQIDGDGIFNLSHIDQKSFSGEVILEEILKKYSNVPITAGIITGYFDMPEFDSPRAHKLYKAMFSLPHVEPSSHGYAHPLIWRKGTVALDVPGYKYSPQQEIKGSIELVNEWLARAGIAKSTRLFQWTGNCLPSEETQRVISQNGFLNINGGDSEMNRKHDSYSFVLPIGILRGHERQIYASFTNENLYTDLWHTSFYGYRATIEAFQNTESPYRLKPFDVYYHFYSGERLAALKALKEVYDWALARPVFAMWTSRYAQMAQDFFDAKITALGADGFEIFRKGQLRTVRFDDGNKFVDMARSQGVLGFKIINGSLYVHLDESPASRVFLSGSKPAGPYLEDASFDLFSWEVSEARIRFFKKGWHVSEGVFAGLKAGENYDVTEKGQTSRLKADEAGRLAIRFGISEGAGEPTEVVITRALR